MELNSILLQDANAAGGGTWSRFIMIAILIVIFYLFMIRPQSKKQKEIRKFREGLQAGDKVITAGGIFGKIKEVKDTYIVLEIADNVKIRIDKGSVYPSAAEASQAAATKDKE